LLSDAERLEVATGFAVRTAEAGSRLVGEGAPGYLFFILSEGTATVTSQGATLRELGPGDYFGEIAIIAGGRRTASVTATSHVKLLVMSANAFRELQEGRPDVAAQIEETMRARGS
jgi:voltage-gated potassium channel